MKNTVIIKGIICKLERVDLYVKRGEYSHDFVKGWQAVDMEGNIIINGHPGSPRSAYEYQQPKYRTKKEILLDIEYYNKEWKERK